MTAPTKPELLLVLRAERSDGFGDRFGHITGYLATADDTKPQGFDYLSRYGEHYGDWSELVVHSQCDSGGRGMYGYELAMRTGDRATLQDAERAVRILKPIQRKLDRMTEVEGYAPSMGVWVNRLARALGVKRVFLKYEKASQNGNEYGRHGLKDCAHAVMQKEAELIEWASAGRVKAA